MKLEFNNVSLKKGDDIFIAHLEHKERIASKRGAKVAHKTTDRQKTANYQQSADNFERIYRSKGKGKALKVKGQVMPTAISCNSKAAKSWSKAAHGVVRETYKSLFVWNIT